MKPDYLARLRLDFGDYIIPDGAFDEAIRDARSSYGERLFETTEAEGIGVGH